ncbi:MAG: hypothetical protein KDD76_06370 [Rickettsiales bacterium]|nr:hypothetical protein [Rickettsiales bacterium]
MISAGNNFSHTFRDLLFGRAILVLVFLVLQIGLAHGFGPEEKPIWEGTRAIKPELAIVPELPTLRTVRALSLGDEQFYFRLLTLMIQNAGDTYGRSTPLKDYDYTKLYQWWNLLDKLDSASNMVPALAGYYFVASQEVMRDVPYVAKYLEEHADRDPEHKWWWYTQAVYIARHKLNDLDMALRIANKLASLPKSVKMPIWARQMPAFIHEARGELEESYIIIRNILDNYENLSEGELNFMMYFIKDRVKKLKQFEKEHAKDGEPVDLTGH